jgi:hypothetical protein
MKDDEVVPEQFLSITGYIEIEEFIDKSLK